MFTLKLPATLGAVLLFVLSGCDDGGSTKETTVADGTAHIANSPDGARDVKIHAVKDNGTVSGTISVTSANGKAFSVDVRCTRELQDALVLGGDVIQSEGGPSNGTHASLVISTGSPEGMVLWFEDPPPADTCEAFLTAMPADIVSYAQPFEGDITTAHGSGG